jgi:hypothetical protein
MRLPYSAWSKIIAGSGAIFMEKADYAYFQLLLTRQALLPIFNDSYAHFLDCGVWLVIITT